ncbi:hypothetical protein O0L34_g10604 [Tuta absoluta]|nr:hypothetical protein O0L34_g10604 [Tuta absoluta]
MQTSKTIKKGKINKILCFGCLSADRKLHKLLQFKDVFKLICKNIVQGKIPEIFLCFECLALLRNVKKFQEKVQKSQNIFRSFNQDEVENNLIQNLSTLSATKSSIFDCSNPINNDALSETKPNLIVDIKIEENHLENDYQTFNYDDDDEPLVEAKVDSPPEIYIRETLIKNLDNINEEHNMIKDETILKDKYNAPPKIENTLKGEITEPESKDFPSNSICLPSVKKVIKKEKVKTKRMNINKDRSELYKILPLKTSVANIYQRMKIHYDKIKYWLEEERNSIFFMRMKYKCEKCATRIPEKKVEQHARRHTKYTDKIHYICEYCTLPFRRKVLLTSHINTHHRYIRCCNACGYKCISKAQIYKHVRKDHTAPRAVQCLECKAKFRSTTDFYKHYRKEHLVSCSMFICDYCNKKCKGRRTMEKHIFNNHTTHACPECPLTFSSPSRLKQHFDLKHKVSRTEASYCVKCDRQFDNVPQFRNHLNSSMAHREERSKEPKKVTYQCPACPNVYAKGYSMKNHYNKVHANQARYNCTDCEKIFLTNSKLKEHIKYHHEGHERERNHICTICGRAFTQKQVLIKHMRTHTGERPFECPHCDSKFAQRTAMVTHVKNIHVKRELKMHSQSQHIYV